MEDWDWELLPHSPETISHDEQLHQKHQYFDDYNNNNNNNNNNCGVIRCDYFSNDHHKYLQDEYDDAGDSSDSPSWIDPNISTVAGEINRSSSCSSSNSNSSGPTSVNDAINTTHEQLQDDPLDKTVAGKEEEERESEANEEEKKKEVVVVGWWRVPLEVLRYYVLKVSTPVWSLSMVAAAIMGFIILRRRYYLYMMKRNTQGLQLKLTLDDKKVSQFMSRTARLNDAFSVVKRVAVIRPSLAAPGLAPWPVMSMR